MKILKTPLQLQTMSSDELKQLIRDLHQHAVNETEERFEWCMYMSGEATKLLIDRGHL